MDLYEDYDYGNYTYENISLFDNNTDDNISTSPPPPTPRLSAPILVSLVIYSLVFLLGVPGNALVIWMTGFEMKRTVNTVWFLNLAIADFLCCLVVPFSIMQLLLDNHWPLGGFACKVIPSVYLVNMYTSVFILTAISLDRCFLAMKPIWCQNHRTVLKAAVACLLLWLLAILVTSPALIFRSVIYNSAAKKSYCNTHYGVAKGHAQNVEIALAVLRLLLGFVLPFLVIMACYSLLIMKVSFSRFTHSNKMLKIILIVIGGFFVCWTPYHVAGLILATNSPTSEIFKSTNRVDPLIVSIAFVNSCINPIIYVIIGQEFKDKFQQSIKAILRNVLTEDLSSSGVSRKTKSTTEARETDTVV